MLRWEPNRCSLLCGLATLLVASGCGVATSTGDDAKEVNLFVAASTASVVEPLMSDFQRVSPAVVRCNAAASSTLAHQIEHGAPADIFLSAIVLKSDRDFPPMRWRPAALCRIKQRMFVEHNSAALGSNQTGQRV